MESFYDPNGKAIVRIRSKVYVHRKTFKPKGLLWKWLAREMVGTYEVLDHRKAKGYLQSQLYLPDWLALDEDAQSCLLGEHIGIALKMAKK